MFFTPMFTCILLSLSTSVDAMFGRTGMEQMQQQMQQAQQQMQQQMQQAQQQMQQAQQQMQQAQEQANQRIAEANERAQSCQGWTKISDSPSIQVSGSGLFCTSPNGSYKCTANGNPNSLVVIGCPSNMKTSRALFTPSRDGYLADSIESDNDQNDTWDFDDHVDRAIRNCKSWSQVSNNIDSANGVYCYIRDFNSNIPGNIQTFKCDSSSTSDAEFVYGNCPASLQSGKASSGADNATTVSPSTDSSASDIPTPADDTTTTAPPATDATTAVPSTSDEWSQFNDTTTTAAPATDATTA